jgi:hypothetical protein
MLIEQASTIKWTAHASVHKWDVDQYDWVSRKYGEANPDLMKHSHEVKPYEIVEAPGNLLTYVGLAYLLSNITGVNTTTNAQLLANGYMPVAVGDGGGSVPTAAATDSDLTASSNKYYNPVDASYPTVGAAGATAGIITVQSTFTSAIANFAWNEWGIFGSTVQFTVGQATNPGSCTMINHKGTSLGTKTSSNVWTLSATLTLS